MTMLEALQLYHVLFVYQYTWITSKSNLIQWDDELNTQTSMLGI